MMELFGFVLLVSISPVYSVVNPLTKPSGDLDPAMVISHIIHLEQTVADLQAQNQAQEQKQAAVMSSVLSKLASTSDELLRFKSDFRELENNHNSTVLELSSITKELVKTRKDHNQTLFELALIKQQLATNNDSLVNVETELLTLKQEFNLTSFKLEMNSQVANITVQAESTNVRLANVTDIIKQSVNLSAKLEKSLNSTSTELARVQELLTASIIPSQMNLTASLQLLETDVDLLARNRSDVGLSNDVRVFFKADLSKEQHVNENTSVVFDHVVDNVGEAYNSTTGIFRAPISGMYIFEVVIRIHKNGLTGYTLIKDGTKESVIVARNHYDSSSVTTMFHVNKGGDVYVIKTEDGAVHPSLESSIDTHFIGLLLQAD